MAKKLNNHQKIWLPPGFDVDQSYALQAVIEGRADAKAQKEAILYIMEGLCGVHNGTADLDSANATYYNEGRRSVGRAINQIAKLNLGAIKDMEKK